MPPSLIAFVGQIEVNAIALAFLPGVFACPECKDRTTVDLPENCDIRAGECRKSDSGRGEFGQKLRRAGWHRFCVLPREGGNRRTGYMQSKPGEDDYLALFGQYRQDFGDVYMEPEDERFRLLFDQICLSGVSAHGTD
ncbi:hypothetical protein [Novosphingobium beihaiensis]|uniref:Uncharacterized protein n=1 Tax=Novosphingobium beihaiensis TaxID=2930389 RepID=A0ABT0BSC4_9SPHN|nr:hypothetical protein [Novosphingobium beihaiensis]MCJ2187952.1 hypothetical protein [Novosphingobium beihaiensis]